MPDSAFERFRQSILTRHSSRDLVARLSAIGVVRRAQHGRAISLELAGDQLVFLAAGSTKLVVPMPDGTEQVLAFHFAGDIIHVPRQSGTRFHLVALDDCTAIAFPEGDFLDIVQQEPAVLRTILVRTLMALQRSRNKSIRLGRKGAQERIADFLLAMAERIGVPDGTDIRLDLPMSRRDIGHSLGLTIETVSRQFSEL
ncbi:MAG: helix-turn-helix domain-containing protein, partial [Erythrobacter sp.]